jgi:predicted O-methyltransferase YrrM
MRDETMNPQVMSVLERIERLTDTWEADFNGQKVQLWSIPPETGRFLNMLVRATKAKRILELGSSGGYSTIWLAEGARETQGHVWATEHFRLKANLARKHYSQAGLDDYITLIEDDARRTVQRLPRDWDFVFMDVDKENYVEFFELAFARMKKGALLCADNAISHAKEMRPYLDFLKRHGESESALIPIGSGEMLTYKV